MPKRTDLKSILIIGAGPIVIGQACEFDYSGTQACIALKEEGYRVILVNANPATIMTDPDLADATYIEPITPEVLEAIIALEKPDAILPTMGGQTALNCALALFESGVLERYQVSLIGASYEAIQKAEDRALFKSILETLGLQTPQSFLAREITQAEAILDQVGLPAIIRPSFTLGGFGGGVVSTRAEYLALCAEGLELSPRHEIQIDASIYGWKEYELEVVRDAYDNAIVVCSIENLDPVGVHTGDSITVAPAQTLTDKEYQQMRQAAIAILRAVGVDTGGANVQFAVHPGSGEMVVIEMNPRVSRSSALASKATGYPIARIAAKLAVGYRLDELSNEMTANQMPASFEPTIDYVVTKIPRFDLEKFPEVSTLLGSQMKSVGEVMAIGRTFGESLQKAIQSLEVGLSGLVAVPGFSREALSQPTPYRFLMLGEALREGLTLPEIHALTHIDPWFLGQIEELIVIEQWIQQRSLDSLRPRDWQGIKNKGFSDAHLGLLLGLSELEIRQARVQQGCRPQFHKIDTCAAEFSCVSNYQYSAYASALPLSAATVATGSRPRIMVLGSGPNRIGQGIEFDYCCVQAVQAIRASGAEAIMLNCNPSTVSTDYHTSDKLYFEPVSFEKVMDVIEHERPDGVVVQFGGQTPLKLIAALEQQGVPILGSNHQSIHQSESREAFKAVVAKLGFLQPQNAIAYRAEDAFKLAQSLSYPLIVRPSYVLGGRAMRVIYADTELESYLAEVQDISTANPLLLESFIADAIEVDIDAVSDGREVRICGLLEHIEHAGVHSGDSACVFPSQTLAASVKAEIEAQMQALVTEIGAIGLVNGQFAIKAGKIYIIEINARASRTIPFISKATGIPWVKVAMKAIMGQSLALQLPQTQAETPFVAIKEAVMPFAKLPNAHPALGPEMKSTGEVMGLGGDFSTAFANAQKGSGFKQNPSKRVLITAWEPVPTALGAEFLQLIALHKLDVLGLNQGLNQGFTYSALQELIRSDQILMILHLGKAEGPATEGLKLVQQGLKHGLPYATTLASGLALLPALLLTAAPQARSIQAYYQQISVLRDVLPVLV